MYIKRNPKLKVKVVDGSSLAVAIVLNSIPPGTKQVVVRAKLSKVVMPLLLLYVKQASRDGCTDAKKRKFPKHVEWISPLEDFLLFNMDGLASGSRGPAGIGGVLQNHNGKVVWIFSENVGFHDATSAELLAIARACELCVSRSGSIMRVLEALIKLKLFTVFVAFRSAEDWFLLFMVLGTPIP
ncbi:hypothetical protein LWI28_028385 [Acer negundo]|uniref:RNase H type-1 domain-containing protein n=1 Tax=Acer negundo TaxID=4023 RepID=A0AAD5NYJ9_ACENE|nr:hypothetical protein LWI28_028385 [Acer negundo]